MTLGALVLTAALSALGGYVFGVVVERDAQRRDHKATFQAGFNRGLMEGTAGYPVPEPVESNEPEAWGT